MLKMIAEIKKKIGEDINSFGLALNQYSIFTLSQDEPIVRCSRSYNCKQELCHYLNRENLGPESCWIVFHRIIAENQKRFLLNLNKIEELLKVPVKKKCFIKHSRGYSFVLSRNSFWRQNLLLLDIFCLLFRSANSTVIINSIEDIFQGQHNLSRDHNFQFIISNFDKFSRAFQENQIDFYSRDLYGPYGVLRFSEEMNIK